MQKLVSSSLSMVTQHFSHFACKPFQTQAENNQGGRLCLHHSLQWAIGIQAFVFVLFILFFLYITYNCITVVFAVLCSILSHREGYGLRLDTMKSLIFIYTLQKDRQSSIDRQWGGRGGQENTVSL